MLLKTFRNVLTKSNILLVFQNRSNIFTSANLVGTTESSLIPQCDLETRLLRVAVIGMPNAGKSTFINNIMDRKVCAASTKVHTTRGKAMAIFTEDTTQIVFVDTPGVVNDKEQKRFNLEKSFIRDNKNMLKQVDLIGVLHDVSDVWRRERLDIKIIKLLEMHKTKPSFLIFNKVDILKSKRKLLDLTRQVTENCIDGKPIPGSSKLKKLNEENKGWPYFQEIFMVSALTGSGLQEVKNYLVKQGKPGEWMFPNEVWTDQSAETVIVNTVKARLLDFLPQEIPYNLKPAIEYFNTGETGIISTVVIVDCPTAKLAKLIAGAGEGRLRQITAGVQEDLQNAFKNYVKIKIVLTPKE